MDKQQAQNIVKDTFENPFDKGRFIRFVRNLLNQIKEDSFTYQGNYIPDAYKQHITTLERIGKYIDGEHKIDILVAKLKKETSIERARTMQRNFIAWYLNGSRGGEMKDAALVAFVSPDEDDWRFSLVKMDYRFVEDEKGRTKVKEEFTPARRWSFLVGKNENSHTAKSQLVPIIEDDEHNPTLAQLEDAFNIEKVTKEFFEKYRELFLWTKETLDDIVMKEKKIKADFENKGVNTVDFAKKLLGQIVFLYFLQKKGWFGVKRDADWGTGPKNFLRELFECKHGNYQNFFNDLMEPLFYQALRNDRRHDDDYYNKLNCKIPFLNGGLFDPIGGFGGYDWVHTDILLTDELFSNSNKTKEGDTGNGILDIFDRYNFTVKEDEPLEKEVAIDPEMLGKAFEKLGAITPEKFDEWAKAVRSGNRAKELEANKKLGIYYTPREIVHYMCQQSLINYLYTELNQGPVAYEKLGDQQFDAFGNKVKKGQLDLTIEHKATPGISKEALEILIKHGEQMGENEVAAEQKKEKIKQGEQKSTNIRNELPNLVIKNAKKIDDALKNIKVCDPAIGSGAFPVGMMSEIVKARNVLSAFIKEPDRTIYHFKRECIEKSLYGVDIDPGAVEIAKLRLWLSLVVDEEDIKQIKPLPNLDYKIVCGNSLLGVEKDVLNWKLFEELERLKPILFNETSPSKKQEYKKQIDELISQITSGHKEFDFEVYFSEVFHEKKGFDVVIANPPYGADIPKEQLENIKKQLKNTNNSNSAALFIDFAKNQFINTNGIVTFIVPKSLLFSEKWFSLVESLSLKTPVLVDVEKGFENVLLEQVVFIYNQALGVKEYQAKKFIDNEFIDKAIIPISLIKHFKSWLCDVSSEEIKLAVKMTKNALYFSQISVTTRGLPLQSSLKDKGEVSIIGGKNIQRYAIISTKGFLNRKDISSFNKKATNLLRPKIVSQRLVAHIENPTPHIKLISSVDLNGDILSVDTIENTFLTTKDYSLLFVIAILNSNLISWYAYRFIFGSAIRTMDLDNYYIGKIPIQKISNSAQQPFIELVDKILTITKDDDYLHDSTKQAKVKEYEHQIDQMVYKLYNLNNEEVKMVEGR